MNSSWIDVILGGPPPSEGEAIIRHGRKLIGKNGLTRAHDLSQGDQAQTRDMFGFKWAKRETYASRELAQAQIAWLDSRYGGMDLIQHLGAAQNHIPTVLDAGAGAGFSAKLIFADKFEAIRYVGADISTAIDIAALEIAPVASNSFFIQCDLMYLPFADASFDIVVSEGVMHHTPSTKAAISELARFVKPGGIFAFYVYAKKAPIREFTDDYIRDLVSGLSPEEAWRALEPLTKLGIALGELRTQIDVPEDVPLLGIKKGSIDIQRLFYWAICKAYYRPEFSFDEMNHINFDWFTPKYAHRQTPEEVEAWCRATGLVVEHLKTEDAGITVVARRPVA